MNHFYRDVPGLGNVALSRHAQQRAIEEGITDHQVDQVFLHGKNTREAGALLREYAGVRFVLVEPEESHGALLVVTIYRVQTRAKARQ